MAEETQARAEVRFEDIQGLVRFGYSKLTEACFLLLRVKDAAAARAWLGCAPVSNAVKLDAAPAETCQVAFTAAGLRTLGLDEATLSQFSLEFRSGMAGDEGRSRLLGDVGANAPAGWQWGGPGDEPHVLLMVYAREGGLAAWRAAVQGAHWDSAFELMTKLDTVDMSGVEPFGFTDGISEPLPDWRRERTPRAMEDAYGNRISLGEFLLGYPNEYRHYTDRPLLEDDGGDEAKLLPIAEDQPGMRDLGRDGCYLVLRTLEQDVAGFWRFANDASGGDAAARTRLAAAMVGREQDGTPLAGGPVVSTDGVDDDDRLNRFNFDADSNGARCPFGAHIRRANPRNGDLPAPQTHGVERWLRILGFGGTSLQDDAKASSRFHRILRRGREYGERLTADAAIAGHASKPSGLQFICLVANIARQFEFLQSAWMMSSKFDAMTDEADPLLGNRSGVTGARTDMFRVAERNGLCRQMTDLPQFVTVRGGAYFFLPSLPALRYLARIR